MQKFFFLSLVLFAILGFSACNPDRNLTDSENALLVEQLVPQFVDNTVVPIYKSLADETIDLYESLVALQTNKSAANVQRAADEWVAARKFWEQSEAFLYGAAADFAIDPHIDHWPLELNTLLALLADNERMAVLVGEQGVANAENYLSHPLLGFHGIEYILFEKGNVKSATKITDNELIYAVAVSGDLRNQCIRLEAAWAGYDNVSAEKQQIIDDFELGVTMANRQNYGVNMKNAGKAGSTYISFTDAAEDIIQGCIDISDEVAKMKIGRPYSGEDINYIESPYSYNSTKDFADNIESIRFAYLGGSVQRDKSLHTLFEKTDRDLDSRILAAIDNSVAKINAIQNFEISPSSAAAAAAIEAVDKLTTLFEEARAALRKAVQ